MSVSSSVVPCSDILRFFEVEERSLPLSFVERAEVEEEKAAIELVAARTDSD